MAWIRIPASPCGSDEDDRYSASLRLELCLQFKAGHAWHANVRDQARGIVSAFGNQKLFRGTEAERAEAIRFDQILQCTLN